LFFFFFLFSFFIFPCPLAFFHFQILRRYGSAYTTLEPRIAKTLLRAFLDPLKPQTTHYGAIVGLDALGREVFLYFILFCYFILLFYFVV